MAKHVILLAAILLVVVGVYARVTGAYFCSYDDFIELHRAAFEDTQEPSRIFTTSHFNSYKYRPLGRAITLMTYSGGDGDPMVFRLRNLGFHLVNVGLIYALGWLLFKSTWVSGVGAALFGLGPLANQTTIGAVWPNTIAHAGFLLAIVMLIISIQRTPGLLWLAGSLVSAFLGLLLYETTLTVFGVMVVFVAAHLMARRGEPIVREWVIVFATVASALITIYFVLRSLFVARGWEQAAGRVPSVGIVLKNLSMYLGALLSPVDPVLANEVLNTPLPSEVILSPWLTMALGLAVLMLGVSVSVALWLFRSKFRNVDWAGVILLIAGVFLPLLPVLSFSDHPSETYLYVPAAFFGLLLSYGMAFLGRQWAGNGSKWYVPAVLLLLILFATATWVRNDRVIECAKTARRILDGLPANLNGAARTVSLANLPEGPATRRYGFYGFRGVDTIGHREMADRAVTAAVQLRYKNASLRGEVVEARELASRCSANPSSRSVCLWVHFDGRVERLN